MFNYKTSGTQLLKNSMYLYFRQILTTVVSLITVRITLSVLGIEDYGINNVVAGTVTMFSFITAAMASGTQRFYSFYIGANNQVMLNKTFKTNFTIYLILALGVILITEIIGLYLINNELTIPENRMLAAHCIFQFAIVSSFFSIMQAPFMASVIAHENMKIFAQMSIFDVTAKLIVVYLLTVINVDKLILYGFLYMIVNLCSQIIYFAYSHKHYTECQLKLGWDNILVKEILNFNVWNLFGGIAWMGKNQGVSMVLNVFLGPVANAAHQLGTTVRTLGMTFAENFSSAMKPQIIKSYAAQDYDRMFHLTYRTAKMNFFLLLVITLPAIFYLPYVLGLWLTDVPPYTVIFCQLLLIENIVEATSTPFATINQATGKISLYQFLIGVTGLLNLPLAYLVLKLEMNPAIVFVVGIILQICIVFIRLIFVQRVRKGEFFHVIKKVYSPCLAVALIAFLISYFTFLPATSIPIFIVEVVWEIMIIICLSYFIGLNKYEKEFIINLIKSKRKK